MKKIILFLFLLCSFIGSSQDGHYTTWNLCTPTAVKSADYTATVNDYIPSDISAAGFTISLPSAPGDKSIIGVKIVSVTPGNTLTIKAGGTDVFNRAAGSTSLTMVLQFQSVLLQYKSSTGIWYVTESGFALSTLDARFTSTATGWSEAGNAVGSNTAFIGSTDARSLRVRTNNIDRLVIDSSAVANAKLNANFLIDQSGGVNTVNPKKISFQPYPGDNSYLVMYGAQNIPGNDNYTLIWDSTLVKLNSPKTLILGQGSQGMLSIMGKQVNGIDGAAMAGAGLYNFLSCPATTTAAINNCIPMMKSGSLSYSLSGTTVPILQWWQIQAPNIKSSTPTTVTDFYYWRLQNPVFDAGITITNNWGLRNDGNSTTGGSSYLGGQVVASPTAIVTMAAGNTTRTAVQMTNQNAPTSPQAGSFWYGTTLGFQYTGNMWASGNASVVGTFSAGSTGTIGAGLRVVGGTSVTTTFSCGTTATLAGNTRIGGTAAPNGALSVTGGIDCSTTFSAGTTSTLAGNTRIGGTTAPTNPLSVTGAVDFSGNLASSGITNTGTMSCSGASTLTGGVTVGSNLTGAGGIWSTSKTSFVGYAVGSGSTVTQGSSRTTAVTCNSATGIITLVSAAGSPLWQSMVVNNSGLGANDLVVINQIAGADKYMWFISHTGSTAFTITFATTGGTTTEQPSFLFAIVKGQIN